jgi:hypothetical protein
MICGSDKPVGPLKYPRYSVWVWYVSQVDRNMGSTGTRAVKAPILVEPYPTAAVSKRLASVQLRESIPWLDGGQSRSWRTWALRSRTQRALPADSKFRCGVLACRRHCPWWSTSTCRRRNCSIPMMVPALLVSFLSRRVDILSRTNRSDQIRYV